MNINVCQKIPSLQSFSFLLRKMIVIGNMINPQNYLCISDKVFLCVFESIRTLILDSFMRIIRVISPVNLRVPLKISGKGATSLLASFV